MKPEYKKALFTLALLLPVAALIAFLSVYWGVAKEFVGVIAGQVVAIAAMLYAQNANTTAERGELEARNARETAERGEHEARAARGAGERAEVLAGRTDKAKRTAVKREEKIAYGTGVKGAAKRAKAHASAARQERRDVKAAAKAFRKD